jgi:tRNA-dihydrouridine synthase A
VTFRRDVRQGAVADVRVSVAPMMDWTDRHCRYFLRLLSQRVLLYTEMVTTDAVLHGDRTRLLGFDPAEQPLALQLGGSDPAHLAECARIGEAFGYAEINLNVGCPSDRVQSGRFGACLMAEPERVADSVASMRAAVGIPVTVKTRTGIDDLDRYDDLVRFTGLMEAAGADKLIVHARKAWLQGLSPKRNREVPPLDYGRVYRLKADFPQLPIHLNGGVTSLTQAQDHLTHVDGVMIGREAYHNPYLLAHVDRRFHDPAAPVPGRAEVVRGMLPYIESWLQRGVPLNRITRHMLGLFHGVPGARRWRRMLSEGAHRPDNGAELLERALDAVSGSRVDIVNR